MRFGTAKEVGDLQQLTKSLFAIHGLFARTAAARFRAPPVASPAADSLLFCSTPRIPRVRFWTRSRTSVNVPRIAEVGGAVG